MSAPDDAHVDHAGSGVPDVSIVIVSYNTRTVLDACLRTVFASRGVRFDVSVIDNGSPDGSADHVAATFPDAVLIRNAENRGFAAANNIAIARTQGRHVLLLNPDTLVREDTVARLAAFLDQRPSVGITGPRVLNADGSLQSVGYAYPTLARELGGSRDGRRVAGGAPPRPVPDDRRSHDVDWVDGCCLMIRRATMDMIGPLDEQFFLYAEELDWCRTAVKVGWRIETCPAAEMTHLGGQSTTQVKGPSLAMFIETRLRYYDKHDGLRTAALVAFMYVLGCVRHWRLEPEKSRAKLLGVRRWWQGRGGGAVPRRAPIQIAAPAAGARQA